MNTAPETVKAEAAIKFESFSITSDGTKDGTKVLINGKPVVNMSSLNLYWYDSSYCPISFSYTVSDPEVKPGTLGASTSYRLRCPLPVSAEANLKAEASLSSGLELTCAQATFDEDLAKHAAEAIEHKKQLWAQLK